jgi:dolichol-phosphate mannosyltransferase
MATPNGAPAPGPEVSVVLAILNERPCLPELFSRLRTLPLPPWEAIVVDDGSTDGSREYLQRLAEADPRLRLIFHDGRQTTLTAQCVAIAAARGPRVVVMDSDLQHPPELLVPMLAELDRGAAVVVASRYVAGGTPGPRPWLRAVYSRGAEWTARLWLAAARQVTDPVSGFFAFRRSIFVPLGPELRGYKLLLFVLVMARGLDVREVPIRFELRTEGRSKVTSGGAFVGLFLREVRRARRLARELDRSGPAPRLAAEG